MLRLLLHVVGVWRDIIGVGHILALGGVNASWGVEALGGGAVRRAVHRGAIVVPRLIHGLEDITAIPPGRGRKNKLIHGSNELVHVVISTYHFALQNNAFNSSIESGKFFNQFLTLRGLSPLEGCLDELTLKIENVNAENKRTLLQMPAP